MNSRVTLTRSDREEKISTPRPKLLVVDDDEQIVQQLRWGLSDEYDVFTAGDRKTALEIREKQEPPVTLLDLGLPPSPRDATEGLRALSELVDGNPMLKVIIVSGNSERANALLALERGAFDFFRKPINLDELKIVLQRAYRRIELEQESLEEVSLGRLFSLENIVGSSPTMRTVFSTMEKVAATDVPLLISGESGTGKELLANAIHKMSVRREGPFVALNCGAIPDTLLESELFGNEKGAFTGAVAHRRGKLEYAEGGTLFLDEIGDLASSLQVKILRFLQEKTIERVGGREEIQVDCRVIAATHQDLPAAVAQNRFRDDLYFRLAVVNIELPPLKDRGDDVIELAHHLIASFAEELQKPAMKLTSAAAAALRAHPWPGNVRELQNRVRRALVLADGPFLKPRDFELGGPSVVPAESEVTLRQAREEVERDVIAKQLRATSGNISRTAKVLGISRPTLYGLLARYGLH